MCMCTYIHIYSSIFDIIFAFHIHFTRSEKLNFSPSFGADRQISLLWRKCRPALFAFRSWLAWRRQAGVPWKKGAFAKITQLVVVDETYHVFAVGSGCWFFFWYIGFKFNVNVHINQLNQIFQRLWDRTLNCVKGWKPPSSFEFLHRSTLSSQSHNLEPRQFKCILHPYHFWNHENQETGKQKTGGGGYCTQLIVLF